MVLVLDNCEHLLDPCAELVHELLRSCAGVTVLATSREPLGVDGESVYRLASMTVPEPGISDPARLVEFESVQLLVERIRAQQPRFAVDATNAAAVADICRRLDGIPLALELVAARAGALTLDELRDRLDERFRLLTRGARSALPRQQTLRALIDWSYDLLSAAEQRTLARCAVFAGSFDLDGAEAVCGQEPIDVSEVIDHVTAGRAHGVPLQAVALGIAYWRPSATTPPTNFGRRSSRRLAGRTATTTSSSRSAPKHNCSGRTNANGSSGSRLISTTFVRRSHGRPSGRSEANAGCGWQVRSRSSGSRAGSIAKDSTGLLSCCRSPTRRIRCARRDCGRPGCLPPCSATKRPQRRSSMKQ